MSASGDVRCHPAPAGGLYSVKENRQGGPGQRGPGYDQGDLPARHAHHGDGTGRRQRNLLPRISGSWRRDVAGEGCGSPGNVAAKAARMAAKHRQMRCMMLMTIPSTFACMCAAISDGGA